MTSASLMLRIIDRVNVDGAAKGVIAEVTHTVVLALLRGYETRNKTANGFDLLGGGGGESFLPFL
jgi:hypothetical protein